MGRRRGKIEEWLKKIKWGGKSSEYIVLVRFRDENDVTILKPVKGEDIIDIRRGFIVLKNSVIPFHRVEEIRSKDGKILYKRK